MNPRFRLRIPVFDLGILLIVLVTTWAAFTAYQTLRQLNAGRARFNEMQGMVQTLEFAKAIEGARLKDVFSLKDLSDLKNECFSIADQVQRTLAHMDESLHGFVASKDRGQFKQFQTESQRFKMWLQT